MSREEILIVDDEKNIRSSLEGILKDEGYRVRGVPTGEELLKQVAQGAPDLVILDVWLPGMDGLQALEEVKRVHPELPVIMISGHSTVETAVKATRLGAYDFIEKPLSLEKTILAVRNALEHQRLEQENLTLRQTLDERYDLVGESPAIQALRIQIQSAAPSHGRVLIRGESGTGKELIARAIHRQSLRAERPFVEVNCAAIPDELIESELFGHERGAFTGATTKRRGKFELADGGTIFLDEVGDMSVKTQAKVLRVLQEQTFERVGGSETLTVDVRVIAASNKNLEEEIQRGAFREDLFYRLNVIPFEVLPLRDRKEDIVLLAEHFSGPVLSRIWEVGEDHQPRRAGPLVEVSMARKRSRTSQCDGADGDHGSAQFHRGGRPGEPRFASVWNRRRPRRWRERCARRGSSSRRSSSCAVYRRRTGTSRARRSDWASSAATCTAR